MKHFLLVLIIACALNYGCEQVITDTDFPYEEVLIIRGIVQAGDILDSLYVGRTLPYEENIYSPGYPYDTTYYDLESYVEDALVTVSTGLQTYPMAYTRSGYYKNDSLQIEAGKTYHLHVEWRDKIADAVTTVPWTPKLDSVNVTSKKIISSYGTTETEYTAQGYCKAKKNDVLSLTTVIEITYSVPYPSPTTPTIYTGTFGSDNIILKRTQADPTISDIITSTFQRTSFHTAQGATTLSRRFVFTLVSYEEAYYKYYLTFGPNKKNISYDPRPVAWNVTGDAIGMFIGASEPVRKEFEF